ncbi:MAG: glycosyltransferase family 2 protein [Patescibacteria group bacterium]
MPKVSVHIVTYNSLTYLDVVLLSLTHQVFSDWSLLIIDNASSDGTVEYLAARWPQFKIVRNRENVGYARAHNQAIQFSDSEYVLTLNPDIILHEWYITRLVDALESDPDAASATGKLLRAQGIPGELTSKTFSRALDSTGILYDRRRWFRDRGAGEDDHAQYNTAGEIFGVSGAAALYRREALDEVAYRKQENIEYFDELFHSYKEDVDLSWRLQRWGWHARYVPTARAYHYRRVGATGTDVGAFIREHASRSSRTAFLSYRNHLYLLIKNERWKKHWKDWPWLFIWEFAKMGYLLVTRPSLFVHAWLDITRNWKELVAKRSI